MIISQGDLAFLKSAMHRLNIRKPIRVYRSTSKKKWPDIWMIDKPIGEIWVTAEWQSHDTHTRRRQLLHEIFHFTGLEHGTYDGLIYSTYPDKDTFSKYKYQEMIRKKNPDLPSQEEILTIIKKHPLMTFKGKAKNVYIVGSGAIGKLRPDSDIDILIEVAPQNGMTARQFTEMHRRKLQTYFMNHNITSDDSLHPQWRGRRLDIYFTYDATEPLSPGDTTRIKLPKMIGSRNPLAQYKGRAYRSESGYKHDRGTSVADIVRFEQEELGNQGVRLVPGVTMAELSRIPANQATWVTPDASYAREFTDDGGSVRFDTSSILGIAAVDPYGGRLVVLKPRRKR